jgi:hypothetical protein
MPPNPPPVRSKQDMDQQLQQDDHNDDDAGPVFYHHVLHPTPSFWNKKGIKRERGFLPFFLPFVLSIDFSSTMGIAIIVARFVEKVND